MVKRGSSNGPGCAGRAGAQLPLTLSLRGTGAAPRGEGFPAALLIAPHPGHRSLMLILASLENCLTARRLVNCAALEPHLKDRSELSLCFGQNATKVTTATTCFQAWAGPIGAGESSTFVPL